MNKERKIKNEIIKLLGDFPKSLNFITRLSELGELLFFGGSIRDYYVYGEYKKMPRDFDIAVNLNSVNVNQFEEFLEKFPHRKNRFGGYKIQIDKIEFDIWNIKNTWAFRENKLSADEKNLSKSVFLSIDGVVYNFNNEILYDDELRWTLENNQISVVLEENPQIELNLLRGLVYKKRYNFDFSSELKEVYKEHLSKENNLYEKLYYIQFSHYKTEYLSKKDLIKELTDINC